MLISPGDETTPGTMTETGVTILLGLQLSTVILQDPSLVCTGHKGE